MSDCVGGFSIFDVAKAKVDRAMSKAARYYSLVSCSCRLEVAPTESVRTF